MLPSDSEIEQALQAIGNEFRRARSQHRPMNSGHEGMAVIAEELEELWDEIKANRGTSSTAWHEAKQVGAMALAYMLEVAKDG